MLHEAGHAALAHLLHHIGHLAVHFEQLIDLLNAHARTRRDAFFARRFEQVRLLTLSRCHREDDGLLLFQQIIINAARRIELLFHFAHTRHHFHQPAHAAHFLHLAKLTSKVVQIERPLLHLLGHFGGVFFVNNLRGFFHEGDDIALAENAACEAFRVKGL